MTFEEIVDQALAMLQRRGRVTYRTLKRQFQLDDDALEDLKAEIIKGQRLAVDEGDEVLVWTGGGTNQLTPPIELARAPLDYTPAHLTERILTSKSALEGERKQVTVLFADMKGSMELLADRDPEEARELLDPVLEHMMEAVHRYEGTVNQVLGDGIMALFGAPIAHEDHAVRACYTAVRMQESVTRHGDELQRTHGVPVQIRVGLNSGEVVVRAIGNDLHMDYTAVGQTTHLAARMEQMAKPGSVLVTAETLRLAEGYVQVKPLGPISVKGLPTRVHVFEVVGARPTRSRLQALAARGLTQFVGRLGDLEALRQALERAGAGHGQVAAVIGEPGVGKTRLFYEFTRSPRTQGWLRLEGHAVSYSKATPYFPVRDLLKAYFQIDEGDEAQKIREKVSGKLVGLDLALGPALPAFLTVLDVPVEDRQWQALDPPQRHQRTLEGIKRLLLRESQVQPLLVVFENLHWIDAETQAVLDSLIESLPTARILLLVNYRPQYQHGWGSRTYYTQLRLDPLARESAQELLAALLGEDERLTLLKQRLIERTEGNPFFLEESVRSLVETQVLMGEWGAYHLAKPMQSIQVPATVQAVLAARIDRLPPEEKRLLQSAAVIGTEVPLALLQAIAELPEEALRRNLAHLQAAEFLYEMRLFPDIEYTFKHALTRQVAYGNLLHERRRMLHARIVEAIEGLYPDRLVEQVERLADHALRGEAWDKALAYCRQAGAKAFAHSAYREAVTYFEEALAALKHVPESRETHEQAIDIRFDLRRALLPLGEQGQILEHLREAETLAEALGDRRRLGWACAYTAHCCGQRGDQDGAIEAGQRALAIAADFDDFGLNLMVNYALGAAYHPQGDHRQAMEYLAKNVDALQGERVREYFGQTGLPAVVYRAMIASSLSELGEFAWGIARGEEGISIAEVADHPFSRIMAYWGVGHLYLRKGELQKAISVLEGGLRLCQVANLPPLRVRVASALGYGNALSGRIAEALPLLEQAVEQGATMRVMARHSLWVGWLSEGYLLAGRVGEAITQAQRALDLSRTHKERAHEAWALRLLGEIGAQRDPPDVEQAEGYYRQALALAGELGMRPLQAHCRLGIGKLYCQNGRRDEARAELTTAIELYRAMEMTFWLPQAEAALAEVEGR